MNACHHLAFHCVDRIAQEKFYTRHFGFKRCRVFNAGQAGEFVMLRLGGMCIEFFAAPQAARGERAHEQRVGYMHLALHVPDIEAKVKELQADGVETDEISDCSAFCEGLRICFFNDPEGNRVEIMEGWTDEDHPPALG